jgi:exonuclease SbcC
MQIKSIEIEGLWSYRDPQSIDISGLPLVVGVGENGAGKSAILVSAILVAFYDKFPTKTKAESITTGAPQGRVSVEFEVDGSRYRVGRTYPRVGKVTAEMLVADTTKKSGWRSLTGNGVTEVTTYMTNLLGMNYETATMTWIAEQGQYGKFSGAEPGDRFRLLSGIFGLDAYAPKAKAAHDKWKKADSDVTRLDGRISELLDSLDDSEGNSDLIATGIHKLTDAELLERAAAVNLEIDRVGQALAELNAGDPARKSVEARQALELVRVDRVNQFSSASAAHARATSALNQAAARATAARQNAQARFTAAVHTAETRAADTRANAAVVRRDALAALTLIATTQRDLPSLVDVVTAHREAAAEARSDADLWTTEIAATKTRHGVLKSRWAAQKQIVDDCTARIETLGRTAENTEHAACFACGQHLSAADAQALIKSQERDIAAAVTRQAEIKEEGAAATAAANAAEESHRALQAEAVNHDTEATKAVVAVTRAQELIATKAERERLEAAAVDASGAAGKEEASARKAASAEHTAALNAADEEETATTAAATAELDAAAVTIAATGEPTPAEIKLAAALAAAEAMVAAEAAEVDEQRMALDGERADYRREAQDIAKVTAQRGELLAARTEKESRLVTVQKERKAAEADRLLHATLNKAYSPGGIPAMVLAGVIEELNEAVNVALARLSKGELAVVLRTSRETATGTTENKVSVYVETPTGTRAYESLSGGQKFRVDLAIRTGLAAAVARGTGTPIGTFILDEGWGTLDEKGILSTIDTLFRLSDDTNVITVSHIESVRDAFPARVEVSMAGGNSVAQVVAA